MDTDDLSRETYDAVILESEKLTHDLTLHFGVLASSCTDETTYLKKAESLIEAIRTLNEFELEALFFGNIPNRGRLNLTLTKMMNNIEKVRKIPLEQRHYDF